MQEKNLKNFKEELKKFGVFYTPKQLAINLLSFEDIKNIKNAYDPTAGQGNLLSILPDNIPKYGQELFEEELEKCYKNVKNFQGVVGDVLKTPAYLDKRFDLIFSNPPFSVSWDPPKDKNNDVRFIDVPTIPTKKYADFAFLIHSLYLLSDTGTLIIMMFPGTGYRQGREQTLRKYLIDNNLIDKIFFSNPSHFVDTSVGIMTLYIKKNKKTSDILIISETQDKAKIITKKEIEEQNYTITENIFFPIEEVKKVIDPYNLEMDIRNHSLKRLKNELELKLLIREIDDNFPPISDYIEDIIKIIEVYKKLI